jgi:hypothetical protein
MLGRVLVALLTGEGNCLGAEQHREQHHYEQTAPKLALRHRHSFIVKEKRARERPSS